ncbi:MAG: hypothetical protein U0Y96_09915 [Candidatus Kapaibacterium sp.]|nr:hypothetical protein [Bacteroidota bacterium]
MKDYVYEFLKEYKLSPHKAYESKVFEYGGVIHNYKWVHFILDNVQNIIDFEKSTFAVYLDAMTQFHKFSSIQINSLNEYVKVSSKDLSVEIENVKFTSDFRQHEYDLFILPAPIYLFHKIILSKRLALSLQKTKITSYRYKELPGWE